MKLTKFETYLPIFTGFYNTIFDESDSFINYALDDEENFRKNYPELAAVPWETIKKDFWDCVDYSAGNLAVVQALADTLPGLLPEFVHSIKFQSLRSPREYNFENDAVDVEIEIDAEAVLKYLAENMLAFEAWLKKRYTSRDGFYSFHSTDSADWLDPSKWGGHKAGAILDFIASEEMDDPQMGMYYAANGSEAFSNAVTLNFETLLNN